MAKPGDMYAGDEAWSEWFERCAVSRCRAVQRNALVSEIMPAMLSHASRYGVSREEALHGDLVSEFDAYFCLAGSRDVRKPLKSYYRYRMAVERIEMRDFVLGMIFGSRTGRINDIARSFVAVIKGWKARTRTNADGTRSLEWERSAGEVIEDGGNDIRPTARSGAIGMDDDAIIETVFSRIAKALSLDAPGVATLIISSARGVSASSPDVLSRLGVAKSRAYELRTRCMELAETMFREAGIDVDDIEFAGRLISKADDIAGRQR